MTLDDNSKGKPEGWNHPSEVEEQMHNEKMKVLKEIAMYGFMGILLLVVIMLASCTSCCSSWAFRQFMIGFNGG